MKSSPVTPVAALDPLPRSIPFESTIILPWSSRKREVKRIASSAISCEASSCTAVRRFCPVHVRRHDLFVFLQQASCSQEKKKGPEYPSPLLHQPTVFASCENSVILSESLFFLDICSSSELFLDICYCLLNMAQKQGDNGRTCRH